MGGSVSTERDYAWPEASAEVDALARALESETPLSAEAVEWLTLLTLEVEDRLESETFSASGVRGEHGDEEEEEEEEEEMAEPAAKRARLALMHAVQTADLAEAAAAAPPGSAAAAAAAAAAEETSALELVPPEILREIVAYFSSERDFLSLRTSSKLLRTKLAQQKIGNLEEQARIPAFEGVRVLCSWDDRVVTHSVVGRGVFWVYKALELGGHTAQPFRDPDDLLISTAVSWRGFLATGSWIKDPDEFAPVLRHTGIVRLWRTNGTIFRSINLEDQLQGVTDLLVWQDSLLVFTLLGTIFVLDSPTTETPRVAPVERPLVGPVAVVGDWVAAAAVPNRLLLWDPKTDASAAIIIRQQATKLVALDDRTLVLASTENMQTLRFAHTGEDVVAAARTAVLGPPIKPLEMWMAFRATKLVCAIKWRHQLITLTNYRRGPFSERIRAPLDAAQLAVYNESLDSLQRIKLPGPVNSCVAIKDGIAIASQEQIRIFRARTLPRELFFPLE